MVPAVPLAITSGAVIRHSLGRSCHLGLISSRPIVDIDRGVTLICTKLAIVSSAGASVSQRRSGGNERSPDVPSNREHSEENSN